MIKTGNHSFFYNLGIIQKIHYKIKIFDNRFHYIKKAICISQKKAAPKFRGGRDYMAEVLITCFYHSSRSLA